MTAIFDWIEKNRFFFFGLILAVCVLFYASCTPQVVSPLDSAKIVDEQGLKIEVEQWRQQQDLTNLKFQVAAADLQKQIENQKKINEIIGQFAASPDPVSWPGLLLSGGGLGAIVDNIRKRGVIAGLKRNKT